MQQGITGYHTTPHSATGGNLSNGECHFCAVKWFLKCIKVGNAQKQHIVSYVLLSFWFFSGPLDLAKHRQRRHRRYTWSFGEVACHTNNNGNNKNYIKSKELHDCRSFATDRVLLLHTSNLHCATTHQAATVAAEVAEALAATTHINKTIKMYK